MEIRKKERECAKLRQLVGEELLQKSVSDGRVKRILHTVNGLLDGDKLEEPQSSFLLDQAIKMIIKVARLPN